MQGGVCQICGVPDGTTKPLHTDHDHSAQLGPDGEGGPIRGLLCRRCNRVLGMVGDGRTDAFYSARLLVRMARYLFAHDSPVEWVPTTAPDLDRLSPDTWRDLFTVYAVGDERSPGDTAQQDWRLPLLESSLHRLLTELFGRQAHATGDRVVGKRGRQMARTAPGMDVGRVFSVEHWRSETESRLRPWIESVAVAALARSASAPDVEGVRRVTGEHAEQLAERLTRASARRLAVALEGSTGLSESGVRCRITAAFTSGARASQVACRETARAWEAMRSSA
jgi:hypothetical protein